jgi:hypothetical protein
MAISRQLPSADNLFCFTRHVFKVIAYSTSRMEGRIIAVTHDIR